MKRERLIAALAGLDAENPIWLALQQIIAEQMETEMSALLQPNLSDEGAHYNRGRVAGLDNLRDTLTQLWNESRT